MKTMNLYYLNVDVDSKKKGDADYLDSLVKKVKNSDAIGINFNKDSASKRLVKAFHQNGLLVSICTVDKKSDMKKVLYYLPDNITTRNPKLLNEIIATHIQ